MRTQCAYRSLHDGPSQNHTPNLETLWSRGGIRIYQGDWKKILSWPKRPRMDHNPFYRFLPTRFELKAADIEDCFFGFPPPVIPIYNTKQIGMLHVGMTVHSKREPQYSNVERGGTPLLFCDHYQPISLQPSTIGQPVTAAQVNVVFAQYQASDPWIQAPLRHSCSTTTCRAGLVLCTCYMTSTIPNPSAPTQCQSPGVK